MSKVNKKSLNAFHVNISNYLNIYRDENKFSYACKRVLRNSKNKQDDFMDQIEEMKINLGSINEKGNLIINPSGGYDFTPENLLKFNKKLKELEQQEVEIDHYYISSKFIPDTVPFQLKEVLIGFVIDPEEDDKEPEN